MGLACTLTVAYIFVSKDSTPLAEEAHDATEQPVPVVEDSKADESKTKAADVSKKTTGSMKVEQGDDTVTEESVADKLVEDTASAKDVIVYATETSKPSAETAVSDAAEKKQQAVKKLARTVDAKPTTEDEQSSHDTFNVPESVVVPKQGLGNLLPWTFASCFRVEGISSLHVKRGPQDYLVLYSNMTFDNFTDKVLGADKKQEIWLKDLDVTMWLTDATKPPKQTEKIVDGKMVVTTEIAKIKIGKVAFDDFIIPKKGLSITLPIAMDQVTEDGNLKQINNPTFNKLAFLFNLMNVTPKERESLRILFDGTCKVAIKGENNTWMWAKESVNFVWLLKPEHTNHFLLKIVE